MEVNSLVSHAHAHALRPGHVGRPDTLFRAGVPPSALASSARAPFFRRAQLACSRNSAAMLRRTCGDSRARCGAISFASSSSRASSLRQPLYALRYTHWQRPCQPARAVRAACMHAPMHLVLVSSGSREPGGVPSALPAATDVPAGCAPTTPRITIYTLAAAVPAVSTLIQE